MRAPSALICLTAAWSLFSTPIRGQLTLHPPSLIHCANDEAIPAPKPGDAASCVSALVNNQTASFRIFNYSFQWNGLEIASGSKFIAAFSQAAVKAELTPPLTVMEGQHTLTFHAFGGTTRREILVEGPPPPPPPPACQISPIPNITINEDHPGQTLDFTVTDGAVVTASSSDPQLVQAQSQGAGIQRSVIIQPSLNQFGTATITVSAFCPPAVTVQTQFTVTVNPVNDPPSFSIGPDVQTSAAAGPRTFPGWITAISPGPANEAGQEVAFQVTAIDQPGLFSSEPKISSDGTLSFTPDPGAAGTAKIKLRARDTGGVDFGGKDASEEQTFEIVTSACAISEIPAQELDEDDSSGEIPFAVSSDATLAAASSNQILLPNAGILLAGSGASRTLRLVPAPNQWGQTIVTLSARCAAGAIERSFNLTVRPLNDPPTITPIGDQVTRPGVPTAQIPFEISDLETPLKDLSLTADASNSELIPDGHILLSSTETSRRNLVIAPAAGKSGVATITVEVSDGAAAAKSSFLLTVSEANSPPVLLEIPNQSVREGELLSITVRASDSNFPSQTLQYGLGLGTPEGMNIDPQSGLITWTPAEAQGPGSYSVTVHATDNGTPPRGDSKSFVIQVEETNSAPVFNPIGEHVVEEMAELRIQAVAIDPDIPAQQLSYSLGAGAPPGASIDPQSGVFLWTPTAAQGPGTYRISISAADNATPPLTSSTAFQVEVKGPNQPPEISIQFPLDGARFFVISRLEIIAEARDADGEIAAVEFYEGTSKIGETTQSPHKISWTGSFPGTFTFTARAIDSQGAAAASSPVTILIADQADLTVLRFKDFVPRFISPGEHPDYVEFEIGNRGPGSAGTIFSNSAKLRASFFLSRNSILGDSDDIKVHDMTNLGGMPAFSFTLQSALRGALTSFAIPDIQEGLYRAFVKLEQDQGPTLFDPNPNNNHAMLDGFITIQNHPVTKLAGILLAPENGFLLRLSGKAGNSFAIESSIDLVQWAAAATLRNINGVAEWLDPSPPNQPRKFYRAFPAGEPFLPANPFQVTEAASFRSEDTSKLAPDLTEGAEYSCEFWFNAATPGTLLQTPLFTISIQPSHKEGAYRLSLAMDRSPVPDAGGTSQEFPLFTILESPDLLHQWRHLVLTYRKSKDRFRVGFGVDGGVQWRDIAKAETSADRRYSVGAQRDGKSPINAQFDELRAFKKLFVPLDSPAYNIPSIRYEQVYGRDLLLLHLDEAEGADLIQDHSENTVHFRRTPNP